MVQDTIILVRRLCERQGVALTFSPGEVPRFSFDIEKIKQAVLNLVKNALEAMPEGGKIAIISAATDEYATLTITDTGPGIASDDLPLIFEPFFTRKGAGTGLGLSITRRIIEEHQGKITVESTVGEKTVFTIHLPLTAPLPREST